MTRDEIVEFFERGDVLWAARDADSLATTYTEDCKVISPIFGDLRGRAAIEQSFRKLFEVFPDLSVKTVELIIDGSRVVQVFNANATHAGEFMGLPGTGRKAQFHGVRIMTVAGGLIAEETRLYDFTLLLMQVGVLRGKPGH
jgi:C-1 hydroxylase